MNEYPEFERQPDDVDQPPVSSFKSAMQKIFLTLGVAGAFLVPGTAAQGTEHPQSVQPNPGMHQAGTQAKTPPAITFTAPGSTDSTLIAQHESHYSHSSHSSHQSHYSHYSSNAG